MTLTVGQTVFIDGKQRAKLVLLEGNYAVVELPNGAEHDYPAQRLHAQSQAQVVEQVNEEHLRATLAKLLSDPDVALTVRVHYMVVASATRLTGGTAPVTFEALSLQQQVNFAGAFLSMAH